MRESQVATTYAPATSDLVMRWMPTTGADGRIHLEAHWVPAEQSAPVAHHAA